jgi:hypothetical protein
MDLNDLTGGFIGDIIDSILLDALGQAFASWGAMALTFLLFGFPTFRFLTETATTKAGKLFAAIVGSVMLGLALTIFSWMILVAFLEPKTLNRLLSDIWLIPAAILLSFLAYHFRGRKPVIYGSAEIFIGVLAIIYPIIVLTSDLLPKILAISSGVYIIVRGLDNIEKGLADGARQNWRAFWFRA